ncbi:MAG TPA: response regulator [Burkholderiales bacterium]|jgi:CheY-like chemotaxis protein|nr:response regulator [Burkholderiales bacterium]
MSRVLVVDDNADMRELLRVILESAGYSVDLAADGALGLVLLRARSADVVLTDIFMPNQDGIETIACLRSEFPEAKVIAMSGGGRVVKGKDYLSTAGEIGAHALLRKPFDSEQLLRLLQELVGERSA